MVGKLAFMAALLCAALTFGQTTRPAELVITKGGVYSGTYANGVITNTDGKNIHLDRVTFSGPGVLLNQVTTRPIDLTVTNCIFNGKAPSQAIQVWRFTHLDVEHCTSNVGGFLFCNYGSALDAKILYNRFNNISGATGPHSRNKMAAVSFQNCHIPLEIAWNHVYNRPGKSAVEDNLSLMLSGGLSDAAPALIHDNYVRGGFSWGGLQYSGSGIMVFDPGALTTVGADKCNCHTKCYNNIVTEIANQHITAAGGYNFEIYNNRVCNDGSVLKAGGWGIQIWNYNNITPKNLFAIPLTSVHDNFAFVKQGNTFVNYSLQKPTQFADNETGTTSDDAEENLWVARCGAEKVCIGPLPLVIPATQLAK